jgi:hypothetical protein
VKRDREGEREREREIGKGTSKKVRMVEYGGNRK